MEVVYLLEFISFSINMDKKKKIQINLEDKIELRLG